MKDNELWVVFMVGALATSNAKAAAEYADHALSEYKKRWCGEGEQKGKDDAEI